MTVYFRILFIIRIEGVFEVYVLLINKRQSRQQGIFKNLRVQEAVDYIIFRGEMTFRILILPINIFLVITASKVESQDFSNLLFF